MPQTVAEMTEQELLDELDRVERAIARSATFQSQVTAGGRRKVRVSDDLLALAAREDAAVQELKRRRQSLMSRPSTIGLAE